MLFFLWFHTGNGARQITKTQLSPCVHHGFKVFFVLLLDKVVGIFEGKHLSCRDMLHNSRHVINVGMSEQYIVCSNRILRTDSHIDYDFFVWDLDTCVMSARTDNVQ